jgi:hypothetical protein
VEKQQIPKAKQFFFISFSGQLPKNFDEALGKKKLIVNFSGTAACVFLLPH